MFLDQNQFEELEIVTYLIYNDNISLVLKKV